MKKCESKNNVLKIEARVNLHVMIVVRKPEKKQKQNSTTHHYSTKQQKKQKVETLSMAATKTVQKRV